MQWKVCTVDSYVAICKHLSVTLPLVNQVCTTTIAQHIVAIMATNVNFACCHRGRFPFAIIDANSRVTCEHNGVTLILHLNWRGWCLGCVSLYRTLSATAFTRPPQSYQYEIWRYLTFAQCSKARVLVVKRPLITDRTTTKAWSCATITFLSNSVRQESGQYGRNFDHHPEVWH